MAGENPVRARKQAPDFDDLPARLKRTQRKGPRTEEFSVEINTTTPILGGGAQVRQQTLSPIDIIRVPTIRGHLRFWWRALYGHAFERNPRELFIKEAELWGRAGDDDGGRSQVEVQVVITGSAAQADTSNPIAHANEASAYALWPARVRGVGPNGHLPRRRPPVPFRLTVSMPAVDLNLFDPTVERPTGDPNGVKAAVKAWILFGGYGSRTRRGVGSLTVSDHSDLWLPDPADLRNSLTALFGRDVFGQAVANVPTFPVLAGASLLVGQYRGSAEDPLTAEQAWSEALGWLKDFRQGEKIARDPGSNGRAGRSRWPEADKIRHLSNPEDGLPWAHAPRHNANPVWPRAGFGLPIVGQFQKQSRVARVPKPRKEDRLPDNLFWNELPPSDPHYGTEPKDFQINWANADGKIQDRMASPLIVKALPTSDGFLPCALWLNRRDPTGKVGLVVGPQGGRSLAPKSAVEFDAVRATGDPSPDLFEPLRGKNSVRSAFLDWLQKCRTTRVA